MRPVLRLCVLLALVLSTGGCVQTAMLPADKLEKGETRASFDVGVPMPRINAQVSQGLGDGDLTANLRVTPIPDGPPILGGGLAVRSYVASDLSLEAQLQGTSFAGRPAGLLLFGMQTIPPSEGGWYAGPQVGIVSGPSPDLFGPGHSEPRVWTAPMVGGTVGYGPIDLGSSTRMQLELNANVPIWGDEGEPPFGETGLSVGVFGLLD